MPGIGLTVTEAKGGFFQPELIEDAATRAEINALFKGGNRIKTIAQRSMRPARQRAISDLSPRELAHYRRQMKRFQSGERKTKPKRGYVPSKPGEPPRTREKKYLRLFLFSVLDAREHGVIVGPAKLPIKGAEKPPNTLEFGGKTHIGTREITVQARPFMRPALQAESDRTLDLWKNSITKN